MLPWDGKLALEVHAICLHDLQYTHISELYFREHCCLQLSKISKRKLANAGLFRSIND
jgi:hypothetical protein